MAYKQIDPDLEAVLLQEESENGGSRAQPAGGVEVGHAVGKVSFPGNQITESYKTHKKEMLNLMKEDKEYRTLVMKEAQGLVGQMKIFYYRFFHPKDDYVPKMSEILQKENQKLGKYIMDMEKIVSGMFEQHDSLFSFMENCVDKKLDARLEADSAYRTQLEKGRIVAKIKKHIATGGYSPQDMARLEKNMLRAEHAVARAGLSLSKNSYRMHVYDKQNEVVSKESKHLASIIDNADIWLSQATALCELVQETKRVYDAVPEVEWKKKQMSEVLERLHTITVGYRNIVEKIAVLSDRMKPSVDYRPPEEYRSAPDRQG